MQKLFISLLIVITSSYAKFDKANIDDIHNLSIVYETFLIKVEEKKRIIEYLNLIDFNDKSDVINAISMIENEIEKTKK